MKQKIRLTEGDLHKIIKESVNRILNEIGDTKKRKRQNPQSNSKQRCKGL